MNKKELIDKLAAKLHSIHLSINSNNQQIEMLKKSNRELKDIAVRLENEIEAI